MWVCRKRKLQSTLKQAETLLAQRERLPEPLQQAPQLEMKIKAGLKAHHAGAASGVTAGWRCMQRRPLHAGEGAISACRQWGLRSGKPNAHPCFLCCQHAERSLCCVCGYVCPAAVTEALAATEDGWKLLQQHVVAELTMRELDMQVGGRRCKKDTLCIRATSMDA